MLESDHLVTFSLTQAVTCTSLSQKHIIAGQVPRSPFLSYPRSSSIATIVGRKEYNQDEGNTSSPRRRWRRFGQPNATGIRFLWLSAELPR